MHFGDGQSWTTARRYIVCFVSVWVCEWGGGGGGGGIHMSSHYLYPVRTACTSK